MNKTYSIAELEKLTGLSRRTIHFYTTERLLPPPTGAGSSAAYTEEHLLRLKLIGEMKKSHLRLSGVREALDAMSLDEMRALAKKIGAQVPHWNADAVANWMRVSERSGANYSAAEIRDVGLETGLSMQVPDEVFGMLQEEMSEEAPETTGFEASKSFLPKRKQMSESRKSYLATLRRAPLAEPVQWERIELKSGIELHIRADVMAEYGNKLDKLLVRIHKLL